MKADQFSGIFCILVALYVMHTSYQMELGRPGQPGTGFFPFVCASIILLMAVILLVQSFFRGLGFSARVSELWKGVSWQRPVAIVLIILGYILIVEWLGFALTAFAMVFLLLKAVERLSWKAAFTVSTLGTVVSHVIFNVLLKTALPRGIIGF